MARVVRAVTNALLEDAGYGVGRYVSLEQIIANSRDEYYAALLKSTHRMALTRSTTHGRG